MKDMFGRFISENDIVVYASRSGSTTLVMIAKVLNVTDDRAKVHVIAGNDYMWKHGRNTYNKIAQVMEWVPFKGYTTTIRASHNVMLANGIDAMGIHEDLINNQILNRQKESK